MDDITTSNNDISLESQISERLVFYNDCMPASEGVQEDLNALTHRCKELEHQYKEAETERLIFCELQTQLEEPSHSKAKDTIEISDEETNSMLERRRLEMIETIEVACKTIEKWLNEVDVISKKTELLMSKKIDLEIAVKDDSLSLHHMEIDGIIQKTNVLLASAQAEKDILTQRITSAEDMLQNLEQIRAVKENRNWEIEIQIQSLKDTFSSISSLCGLEWHYSEPDTLKVDIKPSGLLSHVDGDLVEDFHIIFKLGYNSFGCIDFVDVQLDKHLEEFNGPIEDLKKDKDLASFVVKMRTIYQSYMPLNVELCYLRKRHAIDFIQEQELLQLILPKKNVVCSLRVPKSYPNGEVSLISLTGDGDLTVDNISAPCTKTLTAWIKHLESL